MAQRERNVKIVVSASAKGLAQVQSKVSKFQAAVEKTKARRVDVFKAHMDVQRTAEAYDRAAMEARKYASALKSQRDSGRMTSVSEGHLRAAVERSTRAAKDAKVAMNAKRDALHRVTQAGNANAAQMRKSRAAIVAEATATKGEAAAANSATVALAKLNKTTDRTAKSQKTAARATNIATMAIRKQGLASKQAIAWSTRQGRGPLGLRPYEIVNLQYQVNDVVSGLAMGQRPMQVFAQQAGQIIQIFPKIMTGIIKLAPAMLVLTPFILGMVRLGKEATNLRYFETQLSLMGQTAIYSAETLAEVATQADRAGMSLKDAQAAVIAFTKAGVGEGSLGGFVKMAKQLAEVTGVDVTEAVETLADAYEEGVEGVLALDRELNFLTATQYEHVRALAKDGRETDALRVATSALEDKLDDVAGKAKAGGPWSEAAHNLGIAWEKFMNYMANSAIVDGMSAALRGLGVAANAAILAITPGAGATAIPSTQEEFAGMSAEEAAEIVADSRMALAEIDNTIAAMAGGATGAIISQRGELVDELRFALELQAKIMAQGPLTPLDVPLFEPEQPRDTAEDRIAQSDAMVEATQKLLALKEQLRKLESDLTLSGEEALDDIKEEIRLAEMLPRARAQELAVLEEIELQKEIAKDRQQEFVELDAELEASLRRQAGILFDLEQSGKRKAKEKIAEMEAVKRLTEEHKALLEILELQEEAGDQAGAAQTREEIEGVTKALQDAIITAIAYWEALGGQDADSAIAKLRLLQIEIEQIGKTALFTGEFINEGIAGTMVGAFGGMAKAIAEGGNAIAGFFESFRRGAGEFLIQIGEMILQQAILNALQGTSGAGGSTGGGIGGTIAGFLSSIFHDGGVAGSGGSSRMVPSAVFAGAARYHSGGLPGLKSNEVAAILEKGEEVLTRDDSRNVQNGGGRQGDVKVVLVNNPAEAQRQNFQDTEYQKVTMEWLQENSDEINSMLGR